MTHETQANPPPPNWDREIPKYRATRDLRPAPKARFRFEPPFTTLWDIDVWQYGEKLVARGDEISTTAWPHPSMRPLTFGAEKVLEFFKASMKSRLPSSPWYQGRLRLDNGLSGPIEPKISLNSGVTGATAA
jgi:hypothetical protein